MITALVGAQYGSEGKGLIAAYLAGNYHVHARAGAPNAGHTFYHPISGDKWVQQQIPCGWINQNATLVIGPGAVVDIQQLLLEFFSVEGAGYSLKDRLYVDARATVLDWRHDEGGTSGKAHREIGSTGKGVGLARMARINRKSLLHSSEAWAQCSLVGDHEEELAVAGVKVVRNVPRLLDAYRSEGANILLEGTQGSGLSLVHGPWPYVTSADTNAAQLCVDIGIPPMLLTKTILVARTFPIRVAGNSGPLKYEITWDQIDREPELTTVTKKERRVAMWDDDLLDEAIMLNRPCRLALTFADYVDPEVTGITEWRELSASIKNMIKSIEDKHDTRVDYIGTGPKTVVEYG